MTIPNNIKHWLYTLKEWFCKLFDCGKIGGGTPPPTEEPEGGETKEDDVLSGNIILEDLVELFNYNIKIMSIGRKMVFPMYFQILMHQEDYNEKKTLLPVWTPEIIRNFYQLLKEKQDKYLDCRPIAKKWVFSYSPCRLEKTVDIDTDDNDIITVKKGNIVSTAALYSEDIDPTNDIKVSIKVNNSDIIKTANLNLSALDGIDILDEGLFTYKFDDNYLSTDKPKVEKINQSPIDENPKGNPEPPIIEEDNKPLATISFEDNHHEYKYTMKMSPIYISSVKDTRTTSNILKINNPNLKNGHVQIKYEKGKFFLCAFGETRLNEKPVELSTPGNIIWRPLANNSDILMNGEIQVKFKKI